MRITVNTVSDLRAALADVPDWAPVELADGAAVVLDIKVAFAEVGVEDAVVIVTDNPED